MTDPRSRFEDARQILNGIRTDVAIRQAEQVLFDERMRQQREIRERERDAQERMGDDPDDAAGLS